MTPTPGVTTTRRRSSQSSACVSSSSDAESGAGRYNRSRPSCSALTLRTWSTWEIFKQCIELWRSCGFEDYPFDLLNLLSSAWWMSCGSDDMAAAWRLASGRFSDLWCLACEEHMTMDKAAALRHTVPGGCTVCALWARDW